MNHKTPNPTPRSYIKQDTTPPPTPYAPTGPNHKLPAGKRHLGWWIGGVLRARHPEIGTGGESRACRWQRREAEESNQVLADMAIERNCLAVAVDEGSDRYIYNK